MAGMTHSPSYWIKVNPKRRNKLAQNVENVQMFPFAGFAWLRCEYLYNGNFFFFSNSRIWALQSLAMLLRSIRTKSRKELAHDVIELVPHMPAFLMTSQIQIARHKMAALTAAFVPFKRRIWTN